MLHEQEVRGQGTLGSIGVRWRALALLLVADLRLGGLRRAGVALLKASTEQAILQQSGRQATADESRAQAALDRDGAAVQNGVGMVDVRTRQVRHSGLQRGEADNDLGVD